MTSTHAYAIIDSVAQLIVRNLDEELVVRLRKRAAEHGRSAEAEHREILREALMPKKPPLNFKAFLASMPDGLTDEDLRRRKDKPRAIRL